MYLKDILINCDIEYKMFFLIIYWVKQSKKKIMVMYMIEKCSSNIL